MKRGLAEGDLGLELEPPLAASPQAETFELSSSSVEPLGCAHALLLELLPLPGAEAVVRVAVVLALVKCERLGS